MRQWGKHLLINAYRCDKRLISSPRNIELFSSNLVKKIDMVPYGLPMIKYFGHGNKAGLTLVQLIETSNITGHFCDETGDGYIDVFSCKNYDIEVACETVRFWLKPTLIDIKVVLRQAGERME